MKRLAIVVIVLSMYSSSAAAEFSALRYWVSSLAPEEVFKHGIHPPGTNDNLQLVARSANCLPTDSAQDTAFVSATSHRLIAEQRVSGMSEANSEINFYLYSIQTTDAWHPLGLSLQSAHAHAEDVSSLVGIHNHLGTRVHNGPVPAGRIAAVHIYRAGNPVGRETANPTFAHDYPTFSNEPYRPNNTDYSRERAISFVRQHSTVVTLCTAAPLCFSESLGPFRMTPMSGVCPGLLIEQILPSQFLAYLHLPILFNKINDN